MRAFIVMLGAGLLLGQGVPDSVYIRLKERGINPYASPPPPPNAPYPLTLPESDCSGAIRLCSATYNYPGGMPNFGNVQELPGGAGTCLADGEHRTVWFIFTIQTSGTFGFLICPGAGLGGRDYDFALWDVTGLQNPCAIFGGGSVPTPIRCNYSGTQTATTCCGLPANYCSAGGLTGLDATNPQPGTIAYGAGGNPIMPGLNVTAGQTFLLLVDNWSNNGVGFTINFTGTAQYFDNTPPQMDSVYRMCSSNRDNQLGALSTIRVRFNELISPSSVDADGSDFTLFDNANNQIPILSATALNPPQTNTVELTLGQPLVPNQPYTLYINYNDPNIPGPPSGGSNNTSIQDQCSNGVPTTTVVNSAAGDTFVFSVIDTMHIQFVLDTPACVGTSTGGISAQVTGGIGPYQYVLQPGNVTTVPTSGWSSTASWTNRAAGTYTVWIRDAMRCVVRRVVQLPDPPPLSVILTDSLLRACGGQPTGFITAQGQGGTPPYEYSLMPTAPAWTSNPTFSNLGSGNYTLRVRDANGCLATRPVSIVITPAVDVQLDQITQPIRCYGDTGSFRVRATVGGNPDTFTYTLLQTGTTNTTGLFTGLPAGTYTIRAVHHSSGCYDSTTITLTQPDSLSLADSSTTPTTCRTSADGQIQVTIRGGTPPYTYTWTSASGNTLPTNSNTLTGLQIGTYTLSLSDANGCTYGPISWTVGYIYDAQIQGITPEIIGQCPERRTARIQVARQGVEPLLYVWTWSDGRRDTTTQPIIEREYSQLEGGDFTVKVEVTSGGNCLVETQTQFSIPVCSGLIIPSAITPNGDGINDIWNIQALGFQRYTVTVYNRWGTELWTNGGDPTKLWNGTDKSGQAVIEGVYTFVFVGTDQNGKQVTRTGTVTVLR